jgi:hypothetical protein
MNSSAADISSEDISVSKKELKEMPGKIKANANVEIDETKEENDIQTNDKPVNNPTVANNETPVPEKPVVSVQQQNKPGIKDSADKQTAVANKKQTAQKSKSLFADISFMPFVLFHQNSSTAALSRTTLNSNVLSEFKATTISTTLDPSVAFQFAVRKSISSKWFAGTGLQYMQLKETIKLAGEETTTTSSIVQRLVMQNGLPVLIDDTVQTVVKGNREINAVNSYRFISIPLFMQYNAGKFAGFDFSINAGLFFNIHSRYSNSIDPVISSQASSAKNKTGIDVFTGLRFSKMYGRRIGLFAEPSVRFTLKQANIKNTLTDKKIQQAGIAVGVSVLIK